MRKPYALIIFIAVFCQGALINCFSEGSAENVFARPLVKYNASSLRNPFKPDVPERELKEKEKASSEQPVLTAPISIKSDVQGLIWGGNFPQAIIDNKIYKVGDSFGEGRIAAITKDGVTLNFSGQELKLPAPKQVIKSNTLKGGSS